MSDTYTYWRKALELTGGTRSLTRDEMRSLDLTSAPQCGFFRRRLVSKGAFIPVAIWQYEGATVAVVDGKQADAEETWSYCCPHPVTEEAYRARIAGERWADEAEGLSPPPIGHNQGPQDEADILRSQIEAASASVKDYTEIADDETASRAQSLRARLNELSRDADKKREAEKRPHFDAAKAVDLKWQPLVKAAKAAADAIAKALGAHETRKARAAAEQARLAEEARRKAVAEVLAAHPEAPVPMPPPVTSAPVTTIRGAYGRAASVKVVKIAHVKDYDEATTFFRNEPEYRGVIERLAQRAVDAGHTVPGVEIEEQRKVA